MPNVIMPKMGDAMEEGTLLKWLKAEGEEVAEGDPIAEIETDKVTLEIMAENTGTLSERIASEGDSIPVGDPIAVILGPGEAAAPRQAQPDVAAETDAQADGAAGLAAEASPETGAAGDATGSDVAATATVAASADQPATRDTRDEASDEGSILPSPASSASVGAGGAAQNGGAPARDAGERLRASPVVKRLAAEHEIDLQQVTGTGPGGRIVKDDVMPFVTGAKPKPTARAATAPTPEAAAASPAPAPTPTTGGADRDRPAAPAAAPAAAPGRPAAVPHDLSRIRRTTGRRMAEAKREIPHFYVSATVDMSAAVAFRAQVNAGAPDDASKVSFNDMVVKAAALALREFPALNASFEGDALYDHPNIDINIAIALDGGLIAPFIPDADQKSLGAIARMSKDLINRAKTGGIKPEEYQGGTFTTSNLGMLDVDQFIAVINPPQAAILAIGSITKVPVVRGDEIVVGHQMTLSVSADHRAVDGAIVARFLQVVRRSLEQPMLLALG
ncbi:MAG: Dihydrolipoamide acetyltransferase component of pyruvate dehydrogenase complex [uncultured Thermomicrobiales bacterium]|uniref:Dihydrolipoamide acetyltransferase component of pyruvate dehydrogenase complex n=1 Tax=uncultured Thermomicrobiales bacterium TaxID=1645740 RepID=A0A6J4V481_9BACT|nr:MAG: Dihydrolipoamide acetyltransferase component of pyruvate dehydrogenase complex [uncultured Thermomicrobiales bacterium]